MKNSLLSDYERGLGFRRGDVLKLRPGAKCWVFDDKGSFKWVIGRREVTVVSQCSICPHQYDVIAENVQPREPKDRFIKFEINGHDWEKV